MDFIRLCNEILQLEERLKNITISDAHIIKVEIERELGEKYNQLMSWVEIHKVEKISNNKAFTRKKEE